jgi:hypothetical protein
MRHRGRPSKSVESVVGSVSVKRYYGECGPCRLLTHSADAVVGLEKYTVGFRSLALRAGSERLNEMAVLCSVHYSDLWEKYWTQAN